MKFELIVGDETIELEDEDVYFAETHGYLIHPSSGEELHDYKGYVYPFFIPGQAVTQND